MAALERQLGRRLQHNDYLAERSGQAPSLVQVIYNRPTELIGACVMQAGLSMVV